MREEQSDAKNIRQQLLMKLPQVDSLLRRPAINELVKNSSHILIKETVQMVIDSMREEILSCQRTVAADVDELEANIIKEVIGRQSYHLRPIINATGTVIHTNLGRSVLGHDTGLHVAAVASQYSNLEYDLDAGGRGARYEPVLQLLQKLTGAEDALVVNNNAAAVLLSLNTLVKGREVIISRGELVEIGGMFRIPAVIEMSGGHIREVGTTNKTHATDYVQAISENTGAVMKVHTSNYRIIGFTETTDARELSALAHECDLPFINDLGSGLFIDMRRFGLPYEPTVREAVESGADVVTFSGDKLLGGPQAGIIVGKTRYIEPMKKNQLLRALRVDKMTIAALEATLQAYVDEEQAIRRIPVLQMLAYDQAACERRARALAAQLRQCCPATVVSCEPVEDMVGGGSYPEYTLPGYMVTVESSAVTAETLGRRLRYGKQPVVGRIQRGKLCFSVRTIQDAEMVMLVRMVRDALQPVI